MNHRIASLIAAEALRFEYGGLQSRVRFYWFQFFRPAGRDGLGPGNLLQAISGYLLAKGLQFTIRAEE
jgi:hypothetical protein